MSPTPNTAPPISRNVFPSPHQGTSHISKMFEILRKVQHNHFNISRIGSKYFEPIKCFWDSYSTFPPVCITSNKKKCYTCFVTLSLQLFEMETLHYRYDTAHVLENIWNKTTFLTYTVTKVINFPRYNMKCCGENVILRGIVHAVSGFPLHFMLYRRNLDCFSNMVLSV